MALLGASRSPPALLYYPRVISGSRGKAGRGSQTVLTTGLCSGQCPVALTGPASLTSSQASKMEMLVLAEQHCPLPARDEPEQLPQQIRCQLPVLLLSY